MKNLLISISGTHSSGKTTLIEDLKKELPNVLFIPSCTRILKEQGYPINDESYNYDKTQLACMYYDLDVLNQLEETSGKVVILDRCLLDTVVYTRHLYYEGKVSEEVNKLGDLLWTLNSYKYIVLLTNPYEINIEDDGVRSTKQSFRTKVFDWFRSILGSSTHIISGTRQQRVDEIKLLINSQINKQYHVS